MPKTAEAILNTPTRLRFWGVRGSVPTPGPTTVHYGGNTSCVEVRAGEEIIILDAGTGLRPLGRALVAEFNDRPIRLTLLLTHTHWDHIQGLPHFLPIYRPHNHIRILGYEGARQGLVNILSGQMESPYFPVGFSEVPGNIGIEELKEMEFTVGAVRVRAHLANHPGVCVGYRLFTAGGSVAFFPDNEIQTHHRASVGSSPHHSPSLEFSRPQDLKLIEFLRGTDVLVLDAQYDCNEYPQHTGWGHGCVDDAVALALQAQVRQLFLFHHDPDHDDAHISRMVEHARRLVAEQKGALQVEAAREGATVELPVSARRMGQA